VRWDQPVRLVRRVPPDRLVLPDLLVRLVLRGRVRLVQRVQPDLRVRRVRLGRVRLVQPVQPDLRVQRDLRAKKVNRDLKGKRESQVLPQ